MVTCPTFSGIFSLAQKIDWGLPRMWMCQRDQNEGDGPRYKAVVLKVLCKTWSLPAFPLTGSIELLNMVQTFCHQAIKGLHENKFHWLLSVVHIHSSSGVRLWMSVALDIQKKKKKRKRKLSYDSRCDRKYDCWLLGMNIVALPDKEMTEFTQRKQLNLISFM